MILYQIYPRSFLDTNGDGIGDLQGIVKKIPYIADLGADAIWISPFYTSPMCDFGYDIADYRGVDPMFGTIGDFEKVVATAHKYGLKIYTDQVWAHCSDQHPWFQESRLNKTNPKADWFVWSDPREDGYYPNNWIGIFGGPAWTWNAARKQYYLHHFLHTQPALNFWNDEVFEAVMADAWFWAEKGVDGFRVDALPHALADKHLRDNPPLDKNKIRDSFTSDANPRNYQDNIRTESQPELIILTERMRDYFKSRGKDITLLGEIMTGGMKFAAELSKGDNRLHTAYTGELISTELNAKNIKKIIADVQTHFDDPAKMCWSIGNHDVSRLWSRIANRENADDYWRLIVAWYFSLQGSVCWYNGDELGLSEADIPFEQIQDPFGKAFWPEFKGRDGCRTPMPWAASERNAGFSTGPSGWLPIPGDHQRSAVDVQNVDPDSKLNYVKEWMRFRREQEVLGKGSLELLSDLSESVVGFTRSYEGKKLTCMFNFSDQTVKTDVKGKVLQSTSTDSSLGPYGFTIFEN